MLYVPCEVTVRYWCYQVPVVPVKRVGRHDGSTNLPFFTRERHRFRPLREVACMAIVQPENIPILDAFV
jgi:hypothetical protein